MSVAELLAPLVSVTPRGAATVAVLVNEPVAAAEIGAVTVNVAVAPTGRVTVVLIEPLPAAAQVPPPAPAQVQLIEVTPVGMVSLTAAPATSDGPRLVTTTV